VQKLQTAITFDRELGLRRFKNEGCSKWDNEAPNQPPKVVGPLKHNFIV